MFTQIFQNLNVSGLCGQVVEHSIISFEGAPALLLYSYIPAVIIALILSFLIFRQNRKDFTSKAFLLFTILFSLWVINIILQWIAVPNKFLFISWQLTAFLEVGFYLSALDFFVSFLSHERLRKVTKRLFLSLGLVILLLTPSILNIQSYDYENCVGELGILWYFIYGFEIIVSLLILAYGFFYAHKKENSSRKKEVLLFSIALSVFLGIFTASNLSGELLQVYSFNLFGPIGMLLFIGFVTYLILKYKTFNIEMFSTQVLVVVLWFLVASLILINNLITIHIITLGTLAVLIVFGLFLIRSVRREIEQREKLENLTTQLERSKLRLEESNNKLENLNDKLKELDKLKTEFLSLATHQIRSPLTAIKGYASMVVDGDFGKVNDKAKEAVDRILQSSNNLALVIEDFLNVSKIESGGMKYEKANFDLAEVVSAMAKDLSITAEKKGLKLNYVQDEGNHTIFGDKEKIRQVVLNIMDNSIKYTKEGHLDVSVLHKTGKIRFEVKDTGMGVTPEIKKVLFQKFARGDGARMNTTGSGLGLYLAKQIVEAHKGSVGVDSEGTGKGSTFYMELDAVQPST